MEEGAQRNRRPDLARRARRALEVSVLVVLELCAHHLLGRARDNAQSLGNMTERGERLAAEAECAQLGQVSASKGGAVKRE